MRQAVIVSSGKSGDNEYRKSPSGGSTAAIMSLGKSGDNEYRKIRSGGPQTEDDGQILAPPPNSFALWSPTKEVRFSCLRLALFSHE